MAAAVTQAKVAGVLSLLTSLRENKLAEFESQVLPEHNTWLEEVAAETRKMFHTDSICLPKTPSAKRKRVARTRAQKDKENAPVESNPAAGGRVTRARAKVSVAPVPVATLPASVEALDVVMGESAPDAPATVEQEAPRKTSSRNKQEKTTDKTEKKPSPKRRRTDEKEETAVVPSAIAVDAACESFTVAIAVTVENTIAVEMQPISAAVAEHAPVASESEPADVAMVMESDVTPAVCEPVSVAVEMEAKAPAPKRGRGKRAAAAPADDSAEVKATTTTTAAAARGRGKRQKTVLVEPSEGVSAAPDCGRITGSNPAAAADCADASAKEADAPVAAMTPPHAANDTFESSALLSHADVAVVGEDLSVSVCKVNTMVQFWETKATKTPAKEDKKAPAPPTAAAASSATATAAQPTIAAAPAPRGKKRLGKATVAAFGSPDGLAIAAPALALSSVGGVAAGNSGVEKKLEVLLSPVKKGEEIKVAIPPQPELPAPKRAPRKAKVAATPAVSVVEAAAIPPVVYVPAIAVDTSIGVQGVAETPVDVPSNEAKAKDADAYLGMKRDVMKLSHGNKRRKPSRAHTRVQEAEVDAGITAVAAEDAAAPVPMEVIHEVPALPAPVAVAPTIPAHVEEVHVVAQPIKDSAMEVDESEGAFSTHAGSSDNPAPLSLSQEVAPFETALNDDDAVQNEVEDMLAEDVSQMDAVGATTPEERTIARPMHKPITVVTSVRSAIQKTQGPANLITGTSFVASLQKQQQLQREAEAKTAQKSVPQVKALKAAEAAKKAAERKAEEKRAQQAFFAKEKERRQAEKQTAPSIQTNTNTNANGNTSLLNSSVNLTKSSSAASITSTAATIVPAQPKVVAPVPVAAAAAAPVAVKAVPVVSVERGPAQAPPQSVVVYPAVAVSSLVKTPTMPAETPLAAPKTATTTPVDQQQPSSAPAKRNYEEQERLLLQKLAERQKQQADRYASQQQPQSQSQTQQQAPAATVPASSAVSVASSSPPVVVSVQVKAPAPQPEITRAAPTAAAVPPQVQQQSVPKAIISSSVPVAGPIPLATPAVAAVGGKTASSSSSIPVATSQQPSRNIIKLTVQPMDASKGASVQQKSAPAAAMATQPQNAVPQPQQIQRSPVGAAGGLLNDDNSYMLTPEYKAQKRDERTSDETYNIDDLDSGESTDDDEAPRRKIPSWAQGPALKAAIYNQHLQRMDPDDMFPRVQTPDLNVIFPNGKRKNERYVRRGSSAQWAMEQSPTAPSGARPKKML